MEADLVSSLMSRGSLHHLVVSILVHLDPASLATVASCCRLWAAFVREHVTSLSDTGPCTLIAAYYDSWWKQVLSPSKIGMLVHKMCR